MQLCQPPRSETRKPSFAVPPGAFDCHAHIVGPADQYPTSPNATFRAPDALEDAYLKMLGSLGVERMVIVQPSFYGADNTRTVAAVKTLGHERARGVAMVPADIGKDALRELDAAGMRAARFITTAGGGPSLAELPGVARKIADVGWHIEMYVPAAAWPDLLPVISDLPVPVVLDHMGGLSADDARNDPKVVARILELLETGRCWTKLCGYRASATGHPYADVAPLARRLIAAAPDRCVWGTDWPHTAIPGYMPDDGDLMDLLADWEPDAAMRKKILIDNPARLYRFEAG